MCDWQIKSVASSSKVNLYGKSRECCQISLDAYASKILLEHQLRACNSIIKDTYIYTHTRMLMYSEHT